MIKTEFCDVIGVKHPIIQAGIGPFGTNRLSIAAANPGVLGLIMGTRFLATKESDFVPIKGDTFRNNPCRTGEDFLG